MRGRLRRPTVAALLLALVASVTVTNTAPAQTDDEASQIPDCDRTLTPFDDVPPGHWAAADVSCMYSLGVVKGKTPTQFAPSDNTKRSHSAAMMARLWRAFGKDCPAYDGDAVFDDVPADHWAAADIACMHSLGVIKGKTAKKFAPSAKALRSHTAVMMARLWRALGKDCPAYDGGPFTDVPTSHWASRDIVCMHDIGVVNGKTPTKFAPSDDTRRAHTAAMMSRLWRAYRGELPAAAGGGGGGGGAFGGFGGGGDPQAGNQQAGNQQTSGQQTRAITPPPQQVEGTPNAPGAPSLTVGNGSLGVSFSWPPHTGAAFAGFTVWYCTSGELDCSGAKTSYKATNASNPSTTISNLTKGTKYYVRVRAHNLNGAGAWSNASSATPLGAPQAPGNLSAVGGKSGSTPVGSGKLDVSWTAPAQGNNMAGVTGYRLQHSTNGSSWTSVTLSGTGTSTTVSNLENGTAYWVRVQATSSVGYGAWSSTVTAMPSTKPAAPAAPTVSIASRDSLSVSWTAPADGGADITDYDVQYKTSSSSTWEAKSHTGTGRSTTITGLTNGTAYNVQVRATNSVGSSAWSSSTTKTPAAVPAAPAPTVSVASGTSLSVTWTAPANNGAAITDYDVQYKKSTDSGWTDKSHTGTGTSTTITGLTQGTAYNVRVRATNSVGPGAWSSGSGTPAQKPATPAAPTVSIASGTSLSVSWTAPANNGEAITDYDVQYKTSSASNWTTWPHDGTGRSTTIGDNVTPLTQGTAYNVRVRATNDIGSSTWSPFTTKTPATAPPAPTGVTVTSGTSVGSGKLKVSWTAPTSNGGAAITGYKIQWKSGTQEFSSSRQRTDTASPYTITGLTNGTAHTVQVLAVNSVGDSAASNAATGTPHYYPAAPGTPSVVGGKSGNTIVGSGRLNVSWSAPSDNGGATISGYYLRYRVCTSVALPVMYHCLGSNRTWGPWVTWKHNPVTGTSTIIDGLANGYGYQVQVRAKNSYGYSGWSDSGKDVPATTPGTPYHDGTDETKDGTTLKLRYCTKGTTTCYVDDHGDAKITYHYYWKQCTAGQTDAQCKNAWPDDDDQANYSETWVKTPAALEKSITGLTQGKKYAMSVKACNSVGCSDYADPVLGTPHTVPKQPTVTAVRWSTVNSADVLLVDWNNPTDTGGKPINGWAIYYCSSNCPDTNPLAPSNTNWTRVTGTGSDTLDHILSGYAVKCKFWVHVSLKNAAGYGWLSDIAVATPSTLPSC